jgi:hypothetical protein
MFGHALVPLNYQPFYAKPLYMENLKSKTAERQLSFAREEPDAAREQKDH